MIDTFSKGYVELLNESCIGLSWRKLVRQTCLLNCGQSCLLYVVLSFVRWVLAVIL